VENHTVAIRLTLRFHQLVSAFRFDLVTMISVELRHLRHPQQTSRGTAAQRGIHATTLNQQETKGSTKRDLSKLHFIGTN
jgi:hypothetical protein